MKILLIIGVPLILGIITLFLKKVKAYWLSLIVSIFSFIISVYLYFSKEEVIINWLPELNAVLMLSNDNLASICVILTSFFTLTVIFFSKNILQKFRENIYFSNILLTFAVSNIIILSKNLIIILIFWGILGLLVYFMIRFITKEEDEFNIASKTLIILGVTDFCFFLGMILLITSANTYLLDKLNLDVKNNTLIFSLLTIGALGKLGVVPFHNWIPDTAYKIPSAVSGYLIGAIDKIVGIYWLVRVTKDIFVLTQHNFLMLVGALTILIAVFMALQQHNLKKLLSYHAISQIGYMIVGISSGTMLGIIGGVFHMVNHTLYKTLLFLSCDMVEKTTGDVDLSVPKGLSKFLPYSFVFALVASLSISGIPPFNGFSSKWIIYQSLVERLITTRSIITIFVLISALFGSALTLASFIKVIHSVFLSKTSDTDVNKYINKEKFYSVLPMGVLAILCFIFGVFAYEIPIKYLILPMLDYNKLSVFGLWQAKLAFYLLCVGIVLGVIVYLLSNYKTRVGKVYLLGEEEKLKEATIPATDFYLSIKEIYPFSLIYHLAEQKLLDFYNWFYGIVSFLAFTVKSIVQLEIFDVYVFGKKIVFRVGSVFSSLHSGNLHTYLAWVFISILILTLIFIL
ncbi:MAG: proton-conducting transporter membrane subunit [Elusimicrobiota bacterium]|nr:proton-conducting transporter membrane subunit [Elusimicrobiota bacterium]